jgi:imidazolonepropionase-like amidohydrolase
MTKTLFTNVRIYDGVGDRLASGEVLVEGNRIKKVATDGKQVPRNGAEVVDGGGATLMPGLINTHCHLTFTGPQRMSEIPVEEHTLI